MFVVDTNVLVYAANRSSPYHERCSALLAEWRGQASAWYTTWPICYEFLRIVTHPRVFRPTWTAPAAWSFVESMLASPSLRVLTAGEQHAAVAAQVFGELPHLSGNLMHDAHTAVLMREHGLRRIYTRDTDFHRFPFLEPMDPLIP